MDNNFNIQENNMQPLMGQPSMGQQPMYQQPVEFEMNELPVAKPEMYELMEQPTVQADSEFTVRQSEFTPLYQPKQNMGLIAFVISSVLALSTAIIVILVLLITGGSNASLYGEWVSDGEIEFTLSRNGKGEFKYELIDGHTVTTDIVWDEEDDELIFETPDGELEMVYEIIELEDDTMVISDGYNKYYLTKK